MSQFRARHLPSHLGRAAWATILGNPPPGPRLEETTTADVVVVGAGFAGLSAARRLHKIDPNLSIAVLEAGRIAEGAAGRNSGFMIDIPHELTSEDYAGAGDDAAQIHRNRMAQDFAAEAVADYGIPDAFFDRVGKINGAASEAADAHNSSFAKHLDGLNEPWERLDRIQMEAITGSRHYLSGLYTPGTVMLQPAGYIRGLASGLVSDGVRVFERSPALSFEDVGMAWRVRTPKGAITAPKVILAVNGHLESFGVAQGRLMQLFLFAAMTPPLDRSMPGQARWGITPSDPMGTTLRRIDKAQGGDRLVVRTCAALRPGMKATKGDIQRAERVMADKLSARFPVLRGLRFEHVWAGHLCLSLNGVSVTGRVADGVYSACVQNGLGTARGTLTGMAAAEMAMGLDTELTKHFESEAAPKRLPPRPIREIGANAVLRWKERRAAME